jgi:hypothetical protein
VLIPSPQKLLPSLDYHSLKLAKFVSRKPARLRQGYFTEPELRDLPFTTNVDVRRFIPFVAVEEESVSPDSGDIRHASRVYPRTAKLLRPKAFRNCLDPPVNRRSGGEQRHLQL